MSSRDFFDSIIVDSIFLINEEFDKLRIKSITRDEILLFFEDDYFGINVSVEIRESKKKLLNIRMIKIAKEVSEIHNVNGYAIVVE